MADIVLKVVAEAYINGREIVNTGLTMMGLGGDNYFCGGCKREMMHEVPIKTMQVNFLYLCDTCNTLNEIPHDA